MSDFCATKVPRRSHRPRPTKTTNPAKKMFPYAANMRGEMIASDNNPTDRAMVLAAELLWVLVRSGSTRTDIRNVNGKISQTYE
jgi:hypothetical protein